VTLRRRVIRGWTWGDGPVVYLVHGWSGSAQQLAPFVAPLLAEGFRVIAFDGLSHGRSDAGENGAGSSDAVELGRSLDAVFARFGPAQGVVAHSMGALSTILALRDGWIGTERLVFVAPVTGVPDFLRRIRAELGFGDRIQRRMEELAHARTGYPVADLDVALLAAAIERPPLLVVHDERDKETPLEGSLRLLDAWAGAQLHTTSGLGHRRVLADPGVGRLVAGFLAGRPFTPGPPPAATPSVREAPRRPVAAGSPD
jgi:pimeloyl-ACP methyl ester carboxylesterase